MNIEVILGGVSLVLSVVIAILGWIMQRKIERIKIMESQLSDKKYNAYADLVGLFFSVLKDVKKDKNKNPNDMMGRMLESKKNIFMYGSDDVIKAFNKWLCLSSDTNDSSVETQMYAFLNLMIEIRKDMFGNTSKITKQDLLLNLIQNQKEVDAFWEKCI